MENRFKNLFKVETSTKKAFCGKHGEYEATLTKISEHITESPCPLCEAERVEQEQKMEAERTKQEEERKLIELCKSCNIEPEFYHAEMVNYKPTTPSQKRAMNAVIKLINDKRGKVVLIGKNGLGKTFLASIAAKYLRGKIYSMYEISTMIRQSYTNKAERTELEIVDELASIPFLAIDEMGRTKNSESEHGWLSYILDKRHVRHLPFMLLSNGHFRDKCPEKGCSKCFENFMDSDILSRLQEDGAFIEIEGSDYRKTRGRS